MSDEQKRDESTQDFKEQILRDLEALKAKIQADDSSRDAEIAQEEVALLEAAEASLQKKFSSQEAAEADSAADAETGEPAADAAETDFVADQAKRLADMRAQLEGHPSEVAEAEPAAEADQALQEPAAEPEQAKVPLADEADEQKGLAHKVPVTFVAEQVELEPKADGDSAAETAEPSKEQLADTMSTSPIQPLERSEQPAASAVRSRRSQTQVTKKRNKTAKRIVFGVVGSLLVVLAVALVAGWFYYQDSLSPVDSQSTAAVQFEVPEGATSDELGRLLESKGLIKSAAIFGLHAKLKNYNGFKSGYHQLQKSMSVDEIAKELQKEGQASADSTGVGKITVPEGYTLKQISEAVTANAASTGSKGKTPFTAAEFMKVVEDETFIEEMTAKYPKLLESLPDKDSGVLYRLEGYLFPATYDYDQSTTVRGLVEQMLAATDEKLSPYYEQIAAKGHTVNEILTMASLVEKEGSTDEDRRNIASVFFNRIAASMPLQSNIAILYAEGKLGEKTTLSEDVSINTEIDSPYNVYTNTGYMPGPVDSPSLSAIEATINPPETDYLYFVADVTSGTVYFAATYEEHAANVEQYVNSKVNGSSSSASAE